MVVTGVAKAENGRPHLRMVNFATSPPRPSDRERYLIGSAAGRGGNPQRGAMYFRFTPEKNDGQTLPERDPLRIIARRLPIR